MPLTRTETAAIQVAVEALEDLGLDIVRTDDGVEIGADEIAWTVVAAAIPTIRADERRLCLEEVRSMPDPVPALYSAGYRTGFTDARDEILDRIRSLPVRIATDSSQ
jgi:hypothetical protein